MCGSHLAGPDDAQAKPIKVRWQLPKFGVGCRKGFHKSGKDMIQVRAILTQRQGDGDALLT